VAVAAAVAPPPAAKAPRRLHERDGVAIALPAHISDDVAQAILRGVVLDLVAKGLLATATPTDDETGR
jgi:hypothetical protein